MSKRVVEAHGVLPPRGPYSNGIVASGHQIIFVAGQLAWNENGEIVGKGDLRAQYRQVMRNIQAIVEASGGTLQDVCKLVNYVTRGFSTDDPPYKEVSEARLEFIERDFPVSTLVEVSSLMDPDALVEVDAVAVIG